MSQYGVKKTKKVSTKTRTPRVTLCGFCERVLPTGQEMIRSDKYLVAVIGGKNVWQEDYVYGCRNKQACERREQALINKRYVAKFG